MQQSSDEDSVGRASRTDELLIAKTQFDRVAEFVGGQDDGLFRAAAKRKIGDCVRDMQALLSNRIELGDQWDSRPYLRLLWEDVLSRHVRFGACEAGDANRMILYRSVCICRSNQYFKRPLLRALHEEYERVLAPHHGEGEYPRIARIVIVPSRCWPEQNRAAEPRLLRWWRPLIEALEAQARLGARVFCMHYDAVSRLGRRASRLTDFGLYGTSAVGVYERDAERERIKLYAGGALTPEYEACETWWHKLWNAANDRTDWIVMREVLTRPA